MKALFIVTAVAAALALSSGKAAFADTDMESCKVVDKNGKNIIKAGMADCKTATHACKGHNVAGDMDSMIMVPKGQCEKINKGDFSGASQEVKDKIEGAH